MRSVRSFHSCGILQKTAPAPARVTRTKSNVPAEVAACAQNLRLSLNAKSDDSQSLQELVKLAQAVESAPANAQVPSSVYRLMQRTLDSAKAKNERLQVADLQLLFRAALPITVKNDTSAPNQTPKQNITKDNADLELVTRLYSELYRNTKLSAGQKLENGKLYYTLLRKHNLVAESEQLLDVLFKSNAQFVEPELVSNLLEVTGELNPTSSSILNIIKAWPTTKPDFGALNTAIELLLQLKSASGLDELANFLYFTNAHYKVPEETSIVLLDAYLQLPVDEKSNSGGSKVLKQCLSRAFSSSDESIPNLETLELLLMSCIHFQEPSQTTNAVAKLIQSHYTPDKYTKETWDVLAQWAVYSGGSSSDPLESLKSTVLPEFPREYLDCKTLVSVLVAASEKAQCTEAQISDLVEYFDVELQVTPDASVFELLIKRALKSVEVNRARTLFIQSNCDWNLDNNKYIGVLSDLLVQLCRTTSIDRQLVVDTYQRILVFTPQVSYSAQLAMLEMFLHESKDDSLVPVGMFLAEQFGESPDLPFEPYKEIFELIYHKLLVTTNEELASELCVLLNTTIVLPYEAYFPICLKMCSLDRVDVAHLFFRQMRNRAKQGQHRPPGEEIYQMLFAQYANKRYELGVHELDTYFRLDVNNEMTVPILNRIMAGYASLQDSHKMMNLWTEVSSLPRGGLHGPNAETMTIWMHFIAQQMPLEAVDDVWESLPTDFRIKPDAGLLKQYIIANCYHGYYTRALDVVKMAPEQYQIPVSADILETVYNWTLLPNRKEEVKEYAQEHYADQWKQLESSGRLRNVLLPSQNEWGDTDEQSRRWEAIKELQSSNQLMIE